MCKEAQVKEEEAVQTAGVTEEEAAAGKAAPEPAESMSSYTAELEESIRQGPPNDDPVWENFERMLNEKTIFEVTVDSAVKAGVVAYVDNVRGFIPASKLSTGYVENLEEYKGRTIEVIVITADRKGKKLVLSAREAIRMREREAKQAALEACQVGDIMEGTVDSLMDYGAFINLDNGLSGLLHVSQISYKRVEKPSDVLEKGQRVQVKLIAIKEGKLSLSMKALQEAPARYDRSSDRRGYRGDRRDREERDTYKYKETGKATTNLGDLLKNVKIDE